MAHSKAVTHGQGLSVSGERQQLAQTEDSSSLAVNTFFQRSKDWLFQTVPASLTYVLPARCLPSRVIPYQNLEDPCVLAKHLLPRDAQVYPRLVEIFKEMKSIDDLDECEVLSEGKDFLVFIHPNCPDYVIKAKSFFKKFSFHRNCKKAYLYGELHDGNIYRVVMSDRMRHCIRDHGLDRLHAPREWLFPLKESPELDDADYAVIAEKEDLLTIEQTREKIRRMPKNEQKILLVQLFLLFFLTGYQDGKIDNLCFNARGELVVNDSEPIGNVDLSRSSSSAEHRLGSVREQEIECALYGMNLAISESGLPFDPEVVAEVSAEFRMRASQEKASNAMKKKMLVAMTLFLHAAVIVSVFYMGSRVYNYPRD